MYFYINLIYTLSFKARKNGGFFHTIIFFSNVSKCDSFFLANESLCLTFVEEQRPRQQEPREHHIHHQFLQFAQAVLNLDSQTF